MKELDHKKAENWRTYAFELWCWRRLLRIPWTARRSNQSILKEISPEYSLEGLKLKLKLRTLATWCEELTHWKRPWCWERLRAGGEGDNRGWNGWMASPTRGIWVCAGSRSWWWIGSLVCCSPWGCKESDMTERLNWILHGEDYSWLAQICKKYVLDCMYSPFTKITYTLTFSPTTFLQQFLMSYLRCCLPGYSPHFFPK